VAFVRDVVNGGNSTVARGWDIGNDQLGRAQHAELVDGYGIRDRSGQALLHYDDQEFNRHDESLMRLGLNNSIDIDHLHNRNDHVYRANFAARNGVRMPCRGECALGRARLRIMHGMTSSQAAAARFSRFDAVDALRGLAMVWMTVFHFCFDLSHFGFWQQDFLHDPVWTWQRVAIVSLFLWCAGVSQGIATTQGQGWPRFWKRWGQIALAALLVSAGSYAMFPQSFIYFGVLHGIAVMLVLVRLTSRWGRWLWPLGLAAMALPWLAEFWLQGAGQAWAELFNSRALNWLGLVSRKPFTEDYVPLFPWLGVMWWGMASGQWLLAQRRSWLTAAVPRPLRFLAVMGRWSLSYYLLHQPVLIALVAGAAWLLGRSM